MSSRRYDNFHGPERDPSRNLDDWTTPGGREDRRLTEGIRAREADERRTLSALPDVYQVADRVLAPLLPRRRLRAVPRRQRQSVVDALESRGQKATREAQLAEATRQIAQGVAAGDPELALVVLLRAALTWKPEGGWRIDGPRRAPRDGFRSLRDLFLSAACTDLLGTGPVTLDIAQNRARTRSQPGEVFVQASHSGSAHARNRHAVERRVEAHRAIRVAAVSPGLLVLLWRLQVEDWEPDREELVDALRADQATSRSVALPSRPPADAPDALVRWWRHVVGLTLYGEPAPGAHLNQQEKHNAKRDRELLKGLRDAEQRLRTAAAVPAPTRSTTLTKRSRAVSTRTEGTDA